MNTNNSAYTVISPSDPRHRQIIRAALKAKDTDTLAALRGNNHKPIHLVKQVFLYYLMLSSEWQEGKERQEPDYVTVHRPETKKTLLKFSDPSREYTAAELATSLPLDIYDFAL